MDFILQYFISCHRDLWFSRKDVRWWVGTSEIIMYQWYHENGESMVMIMLWWRHGEQVWWQDCHDWRWFFVWSWFDSHVSHRGVFSNIKNNKFSALISLNYSWHTWPTQRHVSFQFVYTVILNKEITPESQKILWRPQHDNMIVDDNHENLIKWPSLSHDEYETPCWCHQIAWASC